MSTNSRKMQTKGVLFEHLFLFIYLYTLHNKLGAHNKDFSNMLKTIDLGSNLNVYTKFKKKKYLKKKFLCRRKFVFWSILWKKILFYSLEIH